MSEDPNLTPPDIDHQVMDDSNFSTGDLSQALGILGLPRFLVRREMKNVEGYYLENPAKQVLGKIAWIQNGAWAVQDRSGQTLAVLWRQHTEDTSVDHLSSLVHLGLHRWEAAHKAEETASIYCLANLDKAVRFFITFAHGEAILDAPSNRPVVKMARGPHENTIQFVDAFDDPVALVHTEAMAFNETHDITFEEAQDPFPVAMFAVALSLEMGFQHGGQWKSPYAMIHGPA